MTDRLFRLVTPENVTSKAASLAVAVSIAAGALFGLGGAAQAAVVSYQLINHPNGGIAPPEYGLRLDGLYNPSNPTAAYDGVDHGNFTFNFEQNGASMRLDYDDQANTIRIHGTAFGGLDAGGAYNPAHSGLVALDFTYVANVSANVGSPDVEYEVTGDSASNSGSITFVSGFSGASALLNTSVDLFDEQGAHDFSFKFNNTDDHRLGNDPLSGPTFFVGWGWLNHHAQNQHIYASDWLFVGLRIETDEVSEPGMALILLGGLAAMGYMRRQRMVRSK